MEGMKFWRTVREALAAEPDRLVLLARCIQCHRPVAHLVVPKDHVTTVEAVIEKGRWVRQDFRSPCRCEGSIPHPSALRS